MHSKMRPSTMKILHHILALAALCGSLFYFGVPLSAGLELLPALWVAGACLFCGLAAEKPRLTAKAVGFLLFDRISGGSKVARLLRLWGKTALLSGALLLVLSALAYFSGTGQNPVIAGKAIGSGVLGAVYALYLFTFVFFPFSVRAARA